MLKLSVEDVYTQDMRNIESWRFSPESCTPVEHDPRMIVRPHVRSRVVPIERYFKQSPTSRQETLVSIDMDNIEDWLPMFDGQIDVAANILINESKKLEKENERMCTELINRSYIIDEKQKLIEDFLNMTLFQKFKMLMAHKLF